MGPIDWTAIVVVIVTASASIAGIVLGIRARRRDVEEEQTAEKAANVLDSWDDLVGRQAAELQWSREELRRLARLLDACQRERLELRGEFITMSADLDRYRRGDCRP